MSICIHPIPAMLDSIDDPPIFTVELHGPTLIGKRAGNGFLPVDIAAISVKDNLIAGGVDFLDGVFFSCLYIIGQGDGNGIS